MSVEIVILSENLRGRKVVCHRAHTLARAGGSGGSALASSGAWSTTAREGTL